MSRDCVLEWVAICALGWVAAFCALVWWRTLP
jgi:hypothetical protein